MQVEDKVVVITGGGSGIGEALAKGAKQRGARHVVVADLDGDGARRVADEIGGTAAQVDVSDEAAIIDLVESTLTAQGPIDLFASNAGFVTTGGVEDSNERIQKMWEVHVLAHIYAARAVLPSMIANGGGYLLNTASAAGLLSQIGSMTYSVTKGAAVSLGQWLSITHHHQGVRVSMLCPQAVETNIVANSPDAAAGILPDDDEEGDGKMGGVASADGVLTSEQTADACFEAMAAERFLVLPHTEVQTYMERKATDIDRWLTGMRRFQDMLHPDGPLPGDAIAP